MLEIIKYLRSPYASYHHDHVLLVFRIATSLMFSLPSRNVQSSLRAVYFLICPNLCFCHLYFLVVLDYEFRFWRSASTLENDLVLQDVVSFALGEELIQKLLR